MKTKTKNKVLALMIALAMAFTMMPMMGQPAYAAGGTFGKDGNNLTWTYDEGTKTLTISGTGEMNDDWQGIYNAPWSSCSSEVTTVVIEDGVTNIGACAFANCPNINSVTIANSVKEINNRAFLHADSLQSIDLPENLTAIRFSAFYGCDILDNVTIPDSVITMEDRVFANCNKLTNVVIGKNVESIEYQAFYSTNIQSIDIPATVTAIHTEAFAHTKIKEITIPKSVTKLGGCIFEYCDDLTAIIYEGTKEEWAALTDGVSLGISLDDVDIACADDDLIIILQGPVRVNDIYPSLEGKWSVGDTGTAKANKPVTWSVSTTAGDKISIDSSTGKFKIENAEKMPDGQYRNAFIKATPTDGSGEPARVTVTLLCRSFNVCFKDDSDNEIAAAGTVLETDTEYYLPRQDQLNDGTVPEGKRLKAWKLTENGKSLEFHPGTSFTYAQYPPQSNAQTRTFTPLWEDLQPFDCDVRELDFGTKKEGYGHLSGKKVTIYNNMDYEIVMGYSTDYERYRITAGQSLYIQPHEEKIIYVYTKDDLPAGEYNGEIILNYHKDGDHQNKIEGPTIDLKFTVTHDLTGTEAVAPTCLEGGNDKYYTCSWSECGKYFSDEQGQNEIEKDSWILPPAGHDWNYTGVDDTITAKCQRKACDHEASVKLVANDKVYDGKPAEATAQKSENWDSEAGIMRVGRVMYKYDGKNSYDNDVPPTNAGAHSAQVRLQNSGGVFGESVVQDFEITKQPVKFTAENKNCSDLDKENPFTFVMDDEKNWHEEEAPGIAFKVTDSSGKEIDPKTAPAGKYTITPSWADGKGNRNYDATFVAGEFDTAHDISKKDRVEPTCTEDGTVEHYECKTCGKYLSDEQGTTEIPASEIIIPATGHTWSTEWSADKDKHWHECTVCHEKTGEADHEVVIDEAVPATCTESGLTEGKHCSVCEEVLIKQESVSAKGHTWDKGVVTKKATTTATGVKTFTCEICKETKTETIPKLAKKKNTLKVKGKTAKVKYKKLKKKTRTLKVSKVIKFTKKGQGKMSYKKSSVTYTKAKSVKMSKKALKKYKKKVAKKIKINSKTGKVTVKKGLKKGTYKVKAKVKAAGNANYKASKWKTVTFKIKVK